MGVSACSDARGYNIVLRTLCLVLLQKYGVHPLISLYVYIPLKNGGLLIDTAIDFKNLKSVLNCSHLQGWSLYQNFQP